MKWILLQWFDTFVWQYHNADGVYSVSRTETFGKCFIDWEWVTNICRDLLVKFHAWFSISGCLQLCSCTEAKTNRKSEVVIKTKLKLYIVSLISDTINSIIDHVIWSSMEAGHVQLLRWLRSLWVEKYCQDKSDFIEMFYFKACAAPSVDTVRSTRTPRISARAVSPHPWIFQDLICYLNYFIWIQELSTACWPACSPASPSCCSGRRPGRDTTSRWR